MTILRKILRFKTGQIRKPGLITGRLFLTSDRLKEAGLLFSTVDIVAIKS
jgi:hypothetical protein